MAFTQPDVRTFLERNSKKSALSAIEIVSNNLNADQLTYLFSLKITEEDWQIAHATGLSRTLICRAMGCENNPQFKRPEAVEQKTSSIGILAEWVLGRLFTKATSTPLTLVATGALKEADFIFNNKKYDIKACAESAKFLYINADAHFKPEKRPDSYLIVRIARDDTIDVYSISAPAVDSEKKIKVYSECFQISLPPKIKFNEELEAV